MIFLGVRAVVISIPSHPEYEIVVSVLQSIVGTVGPFLIILISNLLIITSLKLANKERDRLSATATKFNTDSKLTIMLLLVSIAYIVLSLPYRMFFWSFQIPQIARIYDMSDLYWKLRYAVGAWITFILSCSNSSVNFYLYVIGGGTRYRKDAKDVLRMFPCLAAMGRPKNKSSVSSVD
jgi:predicted benzoate:H+ symporter BenE